MTLTDLLNSEETTYHEYAESAAGYAGWYENPKTNGVFAFKAVDGVISPFWKTD